MIAITWDSVPLILFSILVAVLGVGRFVRAVVYDDFPPTKWWRETWVEWTDGTGWQLLFTCWWCLSFWVSAVCVGWWVGGLYIEWMAWSWWIFWASFALAYLAPMLIVRDEPTHR